MKIKDKTSFQSQGFYNLTNQIQENTVLNRGLLDLGGLAVPQMIMSNNKDERIERAVVQGLYFANSFMAPFVLLPLFNKKFLLHNGIIKNAQSKEKMIMEVSKKYLIKDTELMLKGIRETGEKIGCKEDFENIINRFESKEELRKKLIKTHENVLFADFLATAWMWCATPWAATEFTKLRTKRTGYSAIYGMAGEDQTRKNAEKHEKEKKKKLLISAAIGTVPSIIFPKLVAKGLRDDLTPLLNSKNLLKKLSGKALNTVKKYPKCFDYTKGIFPSKTIFAAIWLLCDYPSAIVSARDKYEKRDRAIRSAGTLVVFFGGDFVLNNIFGQLSDKFLKTKIMDDAKLGKNPTFFKKMMMMPKNFTEIENLKELTPEILKKTKNIGASLYWLTLVANMGLLGFGMPAMLNKLLKNTLKKDLSQNDIKNQQQTFKFANQSRTFDKFKLAN